MAHRMKPTGDARRETIDPRSNAHGPAPGVAPRRTKGPLAALTKLTRRGSAVVEASIAIPALIAITVGGIEFGTLLHLRQTMKHAARESARVLAVEEGTTAEARSVAEDLLPDNDLPYVIDLTAPSPGGGGNRDAVASIAVPMRDVSLADFFGLFDEDDELRVTVTMRSEN